MPPRLEEHYPDEGERATPAVSEREGRKEAPNRKRNTYIPRKKEGRGNGIQQGYTTLWPIDQWLAIIVSSLEQHVSLPSFPPSLQLPCRWFPQSRASIRRSPSSARLSRLALGRSHHDPRASLFACSPPVRKPLLAKLKLRHSARNAETI